MSENIISNIKVDEVTYTLNDSSKATIESVEGLISISTENNSSITLANSKLDQLLSRIEGSNLDTSDATALASQILLGKTAYVNGVKIEGTLDLSQLIPENIIKGVVIGEIIGSHICNSDGDIGGLYVYDAEITTVNGIYRLESGSVNDGTAIFRQLAEPIESYGLTYIFSIPASNDADISYYWIMTNVDYDTYTALNDDSLAIYIHESKTLEGAWSNSPVVQYIDSQLVNYFYSHFTPISGRRYKNSVDLAEIQYFTITMASNFTVGSHFHNSGDEESWILGKDFERDGAYNNYPKFTYYDGDYPVLELKRTQYYKDSSSSELVWYWVIEDSTMMGNVIRTSEPDPFLAPANSWETFGDGTDHAVKIRLSPYIPTSVSLGGPEISVITPVTLNGTVGTPIDNVQLEANVIHPDGTALIVYSTENLPNGLTLDSMTGIISGTPSVAGSGTAIITVSYGDIAEDKIIEVIWQIDNNSNSGDNEQNSSNLSVSGLEEYNMMIIGADACNGEYVLVDPESTGHDRVWSRITGGTYNGYVYWSTTDSTWALLIAPSFNTNISPDFTQDVKGSDPWIESDWTFAGGSAWSSITVTRA